MEWTVFKLISWTQTYFTRHKIDSPRLTAEILLGFCLGVRRLDLYLQHDRPLEKEELTRFKSLIKRRKNREPVAYITGEKAFFESSFQVGPGVLIPRPDTETLVTTTLEILDREPGRPKTVLELGVGSGAIVVSLAKSRPCNRFFAGDISGAALDMARKNACRAGALDIHFFKGSWLDPLNPRPFFDVIVSNPPYIPTSDITGLAPEIKNHEPVTALDGGDDGLDSIRDIMAGACDHLVPGGHLVLEMGFDQKDGVTAAAQSCTAYGGMVFIQDLAGHDRVVHLEKKN
ncbi:MAG: peptide chain release factor N(5)-glutamine methyltransferase [Desulfotignum sp.]|nr:peptide chain release factor N(5)-glutamine methyltransferase [Desulfotignum sp.]MCF8126683.1 peptide chain release factor N(5)-glutamine methyltransferase [Desulfotignum sp.]